MLADETNISRTADRFGVTLRTLRFYEQIGLIAPQRRGTTRIYSAQDRIRLELIGTGKRLGFSLAEIRDLIDARVASRGREAVADDAGPGSMVALMTKGEVEQQLQVLERQLTDVEAAIADLKKVSEVGGAG